MNLNRFLGYQNNNLISILAEKRFQSQLISFERDSFLMADFRFFCGVYVQLVY